MGGGDAPPDFRLSAMSYQIASLEKTLREQVREREGIYICVYMCICICICVKNWNEELGDRGISSKIMFCKLCV